jgi:hypothetical protein
MPLCPLAAGQPYLITGNRIAKWIQLITFFVHVEREDLPVLENSPV